MTDFSVIPQTVIGWARYDAIHTFGTAISASGAVPNLYIYGVLVFAYGDDIWGTNKVINNFASVITIENEAVVMVWNQAAGNTNYVQDTSTDIIVLPIAASAVWTKLGDNEVLGIRYANGGNSGVVVVNN